MSVPIIDLFAGPGGLGEGFSSLLDENNNKVFKIALSIEKDPDAHKTLTLRSFFRQFSIKEVPEDYYAFLKGNISIETLYERWPYQYEHAKREAWQAKLGSEEDAVPNSKVDKRIVEALNGKSDWILIGGPPCQAYSIVGRSRRREKLLDGKKDVRVELYKEYLRILAVHNPSVFVMENVKGLLSAETKESPVFTRILDDLKDPVAAYKSEDDKEDQVLTCPGYRIYSLVVSPSGYELNGDPIFKQKDYVIKAEKFGIPQTRHRVILMGIRRDINYTPQTLTQQSEICVSKVLHGLPRLRSGLSKLKDDNPAVWKSIVSGIGKRSMLIGVDSDVRDEIHKCLEQVRLPHQNIGSDFVRCNVGINYNQEWFIDTKIGGACNHKSRGHMESDLHRYFFVSCFARIKGRSPRLEDFPIALLPNHQNVNEGIEEKKFADRFRVQLGNRPSKTITSHISKDGHYYIHPDPTQCRSFTVREAARIQTFPDNYYFCGPRTSQFTQVGNAVPPLLANQVAKVVSAIFENVRINMTFSKELLEVTT